ncbi:hypothetical protein EVAR_82271_1 [Eumeta japonica]|uniref:Uncharacterized protein n=1 Tax=Eumeta variegata TaxID=151549 RepID=A0A4C1W009_EUMVA|nr:hypothetical protein EVAR_82271_1 [Eumeta japonica]
MHWEGIHHSNTVTRRYPLFNRGRVSFLDEFVKLVSCVLPFILRENQPINNFSCTANKAIIFASKKVALVTHRAHDPDLAMPPNSRKLFGAFKVIVWVLVVFHTSEAKKSKQNAPATCPIGFSIAYTKEDGDPICYRLKGPEKFSDKFVDCAGNLFTWDLFADLVSIPHDGRIWSDYKTLYPGGPFIDWSFAESTGNILTSTFRVGYDTEQGINDEFCTVFDEQKNLLAVKCNERYHRYCFVRPYEYSDLKECDSVSNYIRFWSPRASCLRASRGVEGSVIRATWRQAKDLCAKEGTSLMQRGWRYANYPGLHLSNASEIRSEPLGLIMTPGEKLMWLDFDDGNRAVERSEWTFRTHTFPVNSSLVALVDDEWQLVDSAHVFYNVICEKAVHLPRVNLTIRNEEGKLLLTVDDSSVKKDDIWCFSDSVIFYPSRVQVSQTQVPSEYLLGTITEGYYWCIHSNSVNFTVSESNKELYIRDPSAVENLYAIKIRARRKYSFENLDKLSKIWSKKLSEYLYLRTHYLQQYGQFKTQDVKEIEDVLKKYKHESGGWSDDDDVVLYQKIKRVYLDRKTVLLHALISSEVMPSSPGLWDDLEVVYMRPTYHCKGFGNVLTSHLGKSYRYR